MSQLSELASAARGMARSLRPLMDFADVLEKAGAIENEVDSLTSARDAAMVEYEAVVGLLEGINTQKIAADGEVSAAKAAAKSILADAKKTADARIATASETAEATAKAIVDAANATAAGIEDHIAAMAGLKDELTSSISDKQAELATLEAAIADLKAKFGGN